MREATQGPTGRHSAAPITRKRRHHGDDQETAPKVRGGEDSFGASRSHAATGAQLAERAQRQRNFRALEGLGIVTMGSDSGDVRVNSGSVMTVPRSFIGQLRAPSGSRPIDVVVMPDGRLLSIDERLPHAPNEVQVRIHASDNRGDPVAQEVRKADDLNQAHRYLTRALAPANPLRLVFDAVGWASLQAVQARSEGTSLSDDLVHEIVDQYRSGFALTRDGTCIRKKELRIEAKRLADLRFFLSRALNPGRGAMSLSLRLDPEGWASVDELIERAPRSGWEMTPELVREIVASSQEALVDSKNELRLSEDGSRIRVTQSLGDSHPLEDGCWFLKGALDPHRNPMGLDLRGGWASTADVIRQATRWGRTFTPERIADIVYNSNSELSMTNDRTQIRLDRR